MPFLFFYSSFSFFFFLFSYLLAASSFFLLLFFLSWSNQQFVTSTTTIKTKKHNQSLSTHKHLSTPLTPIQLSKSSIHMRRWQWQRWWNRLSNPRSPINDPQVTIHNQSTTSTNPWSTSIVPVNPQPQVHKNALFVSVGVSMCGCVWFLIDFVVWLCVGLFNFWLISWYDRVWVCLIFGWFYAMSVLWRWWLVVLGCDGGVWRC